MSLAHVEQHAGGVAYESTMTDIDSLFQHFLETYGDPDMAAVAVATVINTQRHRELVCSPDEED